MRIEFFDGECSANFEWRFSKLLKGTDYIMLGRKLFDLMQKGGNVEGCVIVVSICFLQMDLHVLKTHFVCA